MNESQELIDGIKATQKEIILAVDAICKANNIRYYLAYGTLIGAIRHNGFIPWDDDIDIMMPYGDMQKFIEACKTQLDGEKFFFQSPDTESDYRLTINRVRRNYTTLLESGMVNKDVHSGIFVDIYPLYACAPQGLKRKMQVVRAMKRALYLLREPVRNHGTLFKLGSSLLIKLKTKKGADKAQAKLFEKIAKYDYASAEYVTVLDSGIKEMSTSYDSSWFGEGVYHQFEDIQLKVPNDSDKILTKYFGDYMQLPPENERCYHHDFVKISLVSKDKRGRE